MKYRYKLEMELDDEKIIADGKYEIDSIYHTFRSWFKEEGISEISKNARELVFASNKTDDKEFAKFSLIETSLVKEKWFIPYIKRMAWYDTVYGTVSKEDVIKVLKEDGLI